MSMSDILCIYYSRTGHTKAVMTQIARSLEAELVEVSDGVDYSGFRGAIRAGMEAVRKSTHPLRSFHTERQLEDYRLILIGTPVWGGRCAAPIRGLLKRRGLEMSHVGYVLTRSSGHHYEEIYQQMDGYVKGKHILEVSLRPDDVGCAFWQDKFVQEVQRYLTAE